MFDGPTHQDAKANPSSRFTASVNFGSSEFYRQSINQINQPNFLNNTLQFFGVILTKTFQGRTAGKSWSSATLHSQNTNTEQVLILTLPTLQTSVGRVFPFEPKSGTKKGSYSEH